MFGIGKKKKKNKKAAPQVELSFFGKKLNFAAREAYKLLRTNLMFALPESEEGRGRIIGITSSIRGEGKSTTVVNLASTLAETNGRVLIVEGDLRIPSIHKKLNIRSKPGLSNVLILRESHENYIQSVEVERLNGQPITFDVLVAGEVPPNPSELIGSGRMKRRMEELAKEYDFVLLDLPPVTAVTDALIATKLVDGFVMVVRNEHADTKSLNEAIRQLRLVDAKILGFVFTCAGGPAGGYRYRYRYRYNRKYKYRYYNRYYDKNRYYEEAK
ncbi:MAG: CpsD/CapB family tyrosine-protein kinase [Clostridia bacterium]|nr:CpsD/CapB family tyrosine-protein kinase [Clostridia bacterium]